MVSRYDNEDWPMRRMEVLEDRLKHIRNKYNNNNNNNNQTKQDLPSMITDVKYLRYHLQNAWNFEKERCQQRKQRYLGIWRGDVASFCVRGQLYNALRCASGEAQIQYQVACYNIPMARVLFTTKFLFSNHWKFESAFCYAVVMGKVRLYVRFLALLVMSGVTRLLLYGPTSEMRNALRQQNQYKLSDWIQLVGLEDIVPRNYSIEQDFQSYLIRGQHKTVAKEKRQWQFWVHERQFSLTDLFDLLANNHVSNIPERLWQGIEQMQDFIIQKKLLLSSDDTAEPTMRAETGKKTIRRCQQTSGGRRRFPDGTVRRKFYA